MKLIEENDKWILSMSGREVTRCLVDYAFGIELWEPNDQISIRINSTFSFKTRTEVQNISLMDVVTLGPVLSITHETIRNAIAYKNGRLSLEVSNDFKLDVPADANYEAWEINGEDGAKVVSLPGGGLSIWSAKV